MTRLDAKEWLAANIFDSPQWDDDSPRPGEEACHALADELLDVLTKQWPSIRFDDDEEEGAK